MEVRKVFRAGNSFAVSIPADWVREMHLEDQPVQVTRNEQGEIVVRPIPLSGTDISPEFYEAVERFMAMQASDRVEDCNFVIVKNARKWYLVYTAKYSKRELCELG